MIGEIFYASWGYDQTNIDFLQVMRLTKSGKSAYCKMMKQKVLRHTSFLSEEIVPDEAHGPEFRMKVDWWRDEPLLIGTYPLVSNGKVAALKFRKGCFSKWNGKALHQSHTH